MPRKRTPQESLLDLTEEAGPSSQSQASQSSSQRGKAKKKVTENVNVDSPEFKRKVAELVRYILFADRKKVGLKRTEMVKNVLSDNPRMFNKVFEHASIRIKEVFGLEVVSMESEDNKTTKGYMLVNALEDEITNHPENNFTNKSEESHLGLLLIILSMIFMIDGPLTEANMWYTLGKLGLQKDIKHKVFGDVDKLINQEFVKHHYLIRSKEQSPEGPTFHYKFGPRAINEISVRKILTFVSEVYEIEDITRWKAQYEKVRLEEEQENEIESMDTQDS